MSQTFSKLFGPGTFRFALAIIVVVGHFTRLNFGTAAVYVFFMLSGYWIQRMWMERYRHTRSPWLTFMVSRLWRLLPVFLICSVAALAVERSDIVQEVSSRWEWTKLVLSSIVIFGYNSLQVRPLWPAWSLDVELQYYLVAPFLAVWIANQSVFAMLAAALIVSGAFSAAYGSAAAASYLVFFALGACAANAKWNASHIAVQRSCILLAIVLGGFLTSHYVGILFGGATPTADYLLYNPILQICVALISAPIALASVHKPDSRTDKLFADLSYIVYLVHSIALALLVQFVPTYPSDPFWIRLALAGVTLVLLVAVSLLIWYFVDAPSNRIRGKFVRSRLEGTRQRVV